MSIKLDTILVTGWIQPCEIFVSDIDVVVVDTDEHKAGYHTCNRLEISLVNSDKYTKVCTSH